MKIGIVVYSQTENTYSVAKKIEKELSKSYSVNIERILTSDNGQPGRKDVKFERLPDIEKYDVLIFGSPVEAFSLNRVMKEYLKQITSLENKKVACFVTKGLPFNWTGGNRAVNQMKNICASKKGEIIETGIVKWRNDTREKNINEIVNRMDKAFNK